MGATRWIKGLAGSINPADPISVEMCMIQIVLKALAGQPIPEISHLRTQANAAGDTEAVEFFDAILANCGAVSTDAELVAATPAMTNLSNLITTLVNKDLSFAKWRSQSTYQGVVTQLTDVSIVFTLTPSVGSPFTFPFSFLAANTYQQNRDQLITAFNLHAAAIAAGFIAYPSGASGEWNPSDPTTYTNHFYFKGPIGVSFTVTNSNNALIDVYAGNDQAASTTVSGKVTNVSTPTASGDAANKAYVDAQVVTLEVPLTFHAGVDTVVSTVSPVVMRLRKIGDMVFCSIDAFSVTAFAGTTGQAIKSQAACLPAAFRPYDDNLTFPCVGLTPAQLMFWAPFVDGHIEYFKTVAFGGFTNLEAISMTTVTAVWTTAALDA